MFDQRLAAVQQRIAAAAQRAGRDPAEITLVAVTKTHPPERIAAAIAAGMLHLGENRVQEAEAKIAAFSDQRAQLTWHLIGHLQRNKARRAAALFDIIHSVDSLRLAESLSRHAAEERPQRPLPILLQVNVSGEASKEGLELPGGAQNRAQLPQFLETVARILELPALQVGGLMTIAPFVDDAETVRPVFRTLHELRNELARRFPAADWRQLSMGMTDDFEVAIEEGATIVRIGRALFGERAS